MIPFRVGDEFGFSDLQGNKVVTPQHDHIGYICQDNFEFDNYST
jgi:hypothetical protein